MVYGAVSPHPRRVVDWWVENPPYVGWESRAIAGAGLAIRRFSYAVNGDQDTLFAGAGRTWGQIARPSNLWFASGETGRSLGYCKAMPCRQAIASNRREAGDDAAAFSLGSALLGVDRYA